MAKHAPPVAKNMIGGGIQMSAGPERHRGGKKHVKSIRTTKAKGGGHVVTHDYEGGDGVYHPSADHVFGKDEGVKHVKHYIRHAGIQGVTVNGGESAKAAADGDQDEA